MRSNMKRPIINKRLYFSCERLLAHAIFHYNYFKCCIGSIFLFKLLFMFSTFRFLWLAMSRRNGTIALSFEILFIGFHVFTNRVLLTSRWHVNDNECSVYTLHFLRCLTRSLFFRWSKSLMNRHLFYHSIFDIQWWVFQ
jgi:hypothetical protein